MEDPTVAAAKKTVADASAKEATVTGDLRLKTGQAKSALANAEKAAAAKVAAQPSTQTSEISSTADLAEEFAITEEELSELAEELRVDLKPENGSRGYMGTTETEKKLQRNVELAAARDAEETKKRAEDKKRVADLQMENKALKLTIEEFKGILVSLKEAQESQSISNAKLLYTNKTLVSTSLNERQKQTVVESISRAKSVQEAKTIYETLQSTVEGNSSSSKSPKSLSEALNRGPSPFMARKPQVSADDSFADRMRLLAGIKNN
jgi:myosin heavy subunit